MAICVTRQRYKMIENKTSPATESEADFSDEQELIWKYTYIQLIYIWLLFSNYIFYNNSFFEKNTQPEVGYYPSQKSTKSEMRSEQERICQNGEIRTDFQTAVALEKVCFLSLRLSLCLLEHILFILTVTVGRSNISEV